MAVYYNEIDPFAAAWLRELMKAGQIPDGEVDERSIADVQPDDVRGFRQCHFFAGIGGWAYALRLAGWPDDLEVWTGSCPCQPFSAAGARDGGNDPRHLWPTWFRLIRELRPAVVFGEQVESAIGHGWLDLVFDDLEREVYATGAISLASPCVGAFDIRQRLWFVAESNRGECNWFAGGEGCQRDGTETRREQGDGHPQWRGEAGVLADTSRERRQQESDSASGDEGTNGRESHGDYLSPGDGPTGKLGIASSGRRTRQRPQSAHGEPLQAGANFWDACDWVPCSDGKARPVESGTFPLLDGLSHSLERLRAIEVAGWSEITRYGNDNQVNTGQVLRMVREHIQSETSGEAAGVGVLQQLHASEVLLCYLRGVETTRDGPANGGSIPQTRTEAQYRLLRGLHQDCGDDRASRQWRSEGQPAREPSDALQRLSFILARHAEAYRQEARNAHASSSRVVQLRGYGNAIKPQVAQVFIEAYLQVIPEHRR